MQMNNAKKSLKASNGITLIALVITIIVLLILAGISISMLSGENGILQKATDAKIQTVKASEEEQIKIEVLGSYNKSGKLDLATLKTNLGHISGTTVTGNDFPLTVTYESGNTYIVNGDGNVKTPLPIVVAGGTAPSNSNATYTDGTHTAIIPAGFTVSSRDNNIETGLVIADSAGNEFVWIPVGITKESTTITLGRYVFDENGNIDTTLSKTEPQEQLKSSLTNSYYYTECLKNDTLTDTNGNYIAKDIEKFISSANENGGYFIGRYEARTAFVRSNLSQALTQITEKPKDYVYRWVTQLQAAELSRNMYSSNYFESDLMNSYAWDTATLFLQTFDNRTSEVQGNSNYKATYSRQIRLSSSSEDKGTNNLTTASNIDKICNVYDMAGNCWEWTTETCSRTVEPCVSRGGYFDTNSLTSSRICSTENGYPYCKSFRPILYLLH